MFKNPFKEVEAIIAFVMLFGGTYLMLAPWFPKEMVNPSGGSGSLHDALVSKTSLTLFGLAYLAPGITLAVGIILDRIRLRQWGLFGTYMMIFFIQLLNIVTRGLLPATYLSPVALGIICAIIWWKIKRYGP